MAAASAARWRRRRKAGWPARPPRAERQDEQARRDLARAQRFQRGLWQMFAPLAGAAPRTTSETLLCRCESVSLARIETLIAAGTCDIGSIKRATRAGMGRCQGRYCAPQLAARLTDGDSPTALFAPRPPFKPVPIAAIAARDGG
jgi:D-hydroxyproline dehydrogenase subunit alpha